MHDILITADNLSYKINENRLFSSVSFSLKKGECLHIKGSNGSGKSTLLRIILGITSPTKGEIKANIKKNIAYLGHKNALKSYLSVEDNIKLMGLSNHKDLKEYLETLSLKKLLDIKVANLSYGQQKKLALLRIFLGNTNLIVLDEPFVGLDIENQNILSNFLNKQLQKERGVIFTSHINCDVDSKTLKID